MLPNNFAKLEAQPATVAKILLGHGGIWFA